ncbi:MAG: trypsin-like peptidase domain-containing protein [Pirellulales bacterium]
MEEQHSKLDGLSETSELTGDSSQALPVDDSLSLLGTQALSPSVPRGTVAGEVVDETAVDAEGEDGDDEVRRTDSQPHQLAYSTLLSLLVVLILIVTIRFTVPPLVESLRYSWYRGQLRAEYDTSGERLKQVSLNSLSDVSQLVSRRVGPSVVHINLLRDAREKSEEETFAGGEAFKAFLNKSPSQPLQLIGQGSGVVLDDQGHILTNLHVIKDSGRIEVSLGGGKRVVAQTIGSDSLTDLAVIKVEADGLLPIAWGNSDLLEVGSPVWAVGSPFGLERTVTFGILSGKHRIDLKGTRYEHPLERTTTYADLMQSDVAVNPGNSGGPLANSSGEVIGINTAIVGENYLGVSFSIPSNVAKRIAEGLIKEGNIPRGWFGAKLATSDAVDAARGTTIQGAIVMGWAENSPARSAGVKLGDIIVSFNGRDVNGDAQLRQYIAETPIGTSAEVVLLRDGERMTLQVEIGRRPTE